MCNSDLVYFISEVVENNYDRILPGGNENLLTVIDILQDDNYSLKIDLARIKAFTTFSWADMGKQLDYLDSINLLDNSCNGDLFLILDDKIKEFVNIEISRGKI